MDIAVAMRAQMLGQLIDALSTGAAKTAAAAQIALTQGQMLSAGVLGEVGDGKLALKLQGQTIVADLKGAQLPPDARQPGAQLHLRVDAAGREPRLSFTGFSLAQGNMARSVAPSATTDLPELKITVPSAPVQAAAATPLALAVTETMTRAAARQNSAAPLFANLAVATPALPAPAQAIATALLATRLDGNAGITADVLRHAVAQSGVLHEAQAARGTPVLDAKALLTALKVLLPAEGSPRQPHQPPEPPHRDAGILAHRALPPQLAADSPASTMAVVLAEEAVQARERMTLHQLASLPEPRGTGVDHTRPQHLSFELPIMLGQQTAMAGFRVEREPSGRKADGAQDHVWSVRFAIDADDLGPVHAHLSLAGRAMHVSLWAEDPTTRAAFTAALPALEAALRDNAVDVGDITIRAGKPAQPKVARAGRFLDANA